MIYSAFLLIAGLVILVGGAEYLVRGARVLALILGIPTLVVGLTVVAFGTSAPELFVSLAAALEGNGDVAIGNVVGSNICNILLIIGVTALLSPIHIAPTLAKREMPIMLLSLVAMIFFSYDLQISFLEGAGLMLGLIAYLIMNYVVVHRGESTLQAEVLEEEAEEEAALSRKNVPLNLFFVVLGLAGLVVGAELIVTNATLIARAVGISDLVIGVTLVALGTSLPELATTVVAATRGEADLAVGNAVGSNIFNVLCVIGLTTLITPLSVAATALQFDMVVMLLVSLLIWPVMLFRGKIGRLSGSVMLVSYVIYIAAVVFYGRIPS